MCWGAGEEGELGIRGWKTLVRGRLEGDVEGRRTYKVKASPSSHHSVLSTSRATARWYSYALYILSACICGKLMLLSPRETVEEAR